MAVQQNLGEGCTVLHMLGSKVLTYKLRYSLVYFPAITEEEGNYGLGEAIFEDHTQAVEGCLEFRKNQLTTGMDAE
ncbi:hypothetical protein CDEST_01157 [Colletotrichum destructivum]|uniref:Uncharacterized protein n=1 Tax=Colletotrichum destructivum TaxID=34406 RepID=A0AAX4HY84_9PEZI|nr:hypothetical protein CDEST_01157 [Colletotrichum destructivum]